MEGVGNKHMGSSLDDSLREEGIYEEVDAGVRREVLAWQKENKAMSEEESKQVHWLYGAGIFYRWLVDVVRGPMPLHYIPTALCENPVCGPVVETDTYKNITPTEATYLLKGMRLLIQGYVVQSTSRDILSGPPPVEEDGRSWVRLLRHHQPTGDYRGLARMTYGRLIPPEKDETPYKGIYDFDLKGRSAVHVLLDLGAREGETRIFPGSDDDSITLNEYEHIKRERSGRAREKALTDLDKANRDMFKQWLDRYNIAEIAWMKEEAETLLAKRRLTKHYNQSPRVFPEGTPVWISDFSDFKDGEDDGK